MSLTVASFYRFVPIADSPALRATLQAACRELQISGTILIAPEGLNATVAGEAGAVDTLLAAITSDPRFTGLTVKRSMTTAPPFRRLKVKLKREIVTFGIAAASPGANPAARVGTYVKPADWNALVRDPGTILLDTRNAYEVAVGTFPGAIDPKTRAFNELPQFVGANLNPSKHRKVAMFCTGGIRCEKASAYLLSQGFAEVYHLEGGILAYLEAVPAEESLWQGECYVFDERVAVQHGVAQGHHTMRPQCGHPVHNDVEGTALSSCPLCRPRHG
jgi:UPF0176 protein